jgi:amidophosphoribosyltransferase
MRSEQELVELVEKIEGKGPADGEGKPKEACGVVGVFGHPEASKMVYLGLYAVQHRGQESCGITSSNGEGLQAVKRMGLVADSFDAETLARLPGNLAVGHVRYSTAGGTSLKNAQPITVEYARGGLAVAHNGNLTNAEILRSELEAYGSIFSTTADSEVIVHLIARSSGRRFVDTVVDSLKRVQGAYSLILMNDKQMIGARDPAGFRPLCIGKMGDSYVLASETCALDLLDAEYIRDVEPGELVVIDQLGLQSIKPLTPTRHALCVFEFVYFSRPDSIIFGEQVEKVRRELGRQLARECPAPNADLVIAVPDSGVTAAIGYAEQAKLPFEMGLIRNHYIGRTFIQPSQTIRDFGVKVKLNPVRGILKGKKVVVVDDSLVRGTTSRKIIKMLRGAGAAEVHFRISSPPVANPCFYGMDFPTKSELIINNMTHEEIERFLNVDSLGYMSVAGMIKATGKAEDSLCKACFDGKYPVGVHGVVANDKLAAGAKCD